MKFIVSHEMGHAWLLLNHGGGVEPNVALDYDASIDPDACHYVDDDGERQHLHDLTASGTTRSASAKAPRTSTPPASGTTPIPRACSRGSRGDGRSLARLADPDPGGGRTFQRCVTPARPLATLCADNVTTNEDWLRFWWAWHTRTSPAVPTTTIRDVYERTLDNGGLFKDNYRAQLAVAVGQLVADANQTFGFFAARGLARYLVRRELAVPVTVIGSTRSIAA